MWYSETESAFFIRGSGPSINRSIGMIAELDSDIPTATLDVKIDVPR